MNYEELVRLLPSLDEDHPLFTIKCIVEGESTTYMLRYAKEYSDADGVCPMYLLFRGSSSVPVAEYTQMHAAVVHIMLMRPTNVVVVKCSNCASEHVFVYEDAVACFACGKSVWMSKIPERMLPNPLWSLLQSKHRDSPSVMRARTNWESSCKSDSVGTPVADRGALSASDAEVFDALDNPKPGMTFEEFRKMLEDTPIKPNTLLLDLSLVEQMSEPGPVEAMCDRPVDDPLHVSVDTQPVVSIEEVFPNSSTKIADAESLISDAVTAWQSNHSREGKNQGLCLISAALTSFSTMVHDIAMGVIDDEHKEKLTLATAWAENEGRKGAEEVLKGEENDE